MANASVEKCQLKAEMVRYSSFFEPPGGADVFPDRLGGQPLEWSRLLGKLFKNL